MLMFQGVVYDEIKCIVSECVGNESRANGSHIID